MLIRAFPVARSPMWMRAFRLTRPPLAAALVLCLGLGPAASSLVLAQEGNGAIHGVVYQADEKEKLAGAKVTAINVKTGKQYVSTVTDDGGDYEVGGLPAGTYDVAIEIGGAVYVADSLVDLNQNQHLSVSYAVQPLRPANRRLAGLAPPKGSATPVGGFEGTGAAAGALRGGSFWTSPGGIVLMAVVAGGIAYAIEHNRGNNNASPSMP